MCDVCGCGEPVRIQLPARRSLTAKNDEDAARLRARFAAAGVVTLNVMGSPGSGKTALLEATARALPGRRLVAVSGDLATALDAERLQRAGVVAAPITTGTACHLDAAMVERALGDPAVGGALERGGLFFVENVGNLVCPAIYDLGQTANVVVLSVTEGVDKPLKYPVMFRNAQLVVLTKVDLLPHLPGVSVAQLTDALARVMPEPRWVEVAATRDQGLGPWLRWLDGLGQGATSSYTTPAV
jgi:hydrogenase nickel incorporation protein HypB